MASARARARALLPHTVGLGLALALTWGGSRELERQAEEAEPFAVHVGEAAAVLDRSAPPAGGGPSWTARITPASELERVAVRVDGRTLGPGEFDGRKARRDLDAGTLGLGLESLEPGWHFVELDLERRGGRHEGAVAPVLVGDFARPTPSPAEARCDLKLSASEALLRSLVKPMLERELLPQLRAVDQLGPETELREATLELRDDALRFELEIAGVNTLAMSGVVALFIDDQGQLQAKLVTLSEVDFRGKLRNQARGAGAGGGALVAGIVAPPLAPVGAAVGWWLADDFVTDKARELVRAEVEDGLEQISGVELLPGAVELIPGQPRSRVRLGFCEQTRVRQSGVVAGLWIEPDRPEGPTRVHDLGVPGPFVVASAAAPPPAGDDADLQLDLSVDLINALLYEWTATGLLAEQLHEPAALERANAELSEWTPLRLAGLRPTRPPALSPRVVPNAAPNEADFEFGIGGLELALEGMDPADIEARWGALSVAVGGRVGLAWDADAAELNLRASLQHLSLTCVREGESESGASGKDARIDGCFSEILDAAQVRERVDAQLQPESAALPSLALGALLSEELGLALDALELSRPDPAHLRVSARVHLE